MEESLSLYHIFNSVAKLSNISHAAKELYISQPAVSKAIHSLEENLKTTLFIRSTRGVSLTEEGKLLYEHTRSAFEILSHGEKSLKRIHDFGIGHLRIGASTTLSKHLLLPYLDSFVSDNPHIKITIANQSSSYTLKQLENNTLDIGLVAKPSDLEQFQFILVAEIEDIFVATSSYLNNLKLREHSVRKKHLHTTDIFSTANIMLLDEENVSRKYINDYLKENSIEPKQIMEISSMDLLIEYAKTSLGVACVIKEFVKSELDSGALIQIPLQTPVNKREVGFSYNKNAFLSDSLQKFIKGLQK